MAIQILRRKQVEARVGLSRSTIYEYIQSGNFPPPINIGPKAVGWVESEIEAWLAARVKERRTAQP